MSNSSTSSSSFPNRWIIASTAFIFQLALGSVNAWSVFLKPVASLFYGVGADKLTKVQIAPTNLTFSLTLLALGITAGFGGYFQNRLEPRTIATIGGMLYGLGIILAGVTASAHSLILLYSTYSIIGGIGIGLGYIVPLTMLIKWFPDRRGFITGFAVAGFGIGALVTAQIAPPLLKTTSLGVNQTFIYLGISYFVIVVVAAQFFRKAPDGYVPAGWTPSVTQQVARSTRDYTLAEALSNPRWYVLWLMLALNITAGAALISVASPLAQKFTGVNEVTAAIIVSIIAIFNGIGRLFWGWVSDAIGRPITFLVLFIIQIIAFLTLAQVGTGAFGLLLIPAAIIGLCYGGGFGTMPAFAADFFGPKNSGMIYGAMLTAWSAGGIVGPNLIASYSDYHTPLYIISVIMLVSCIFPVLAHIMVRRQAASNIAKILSH